MLRAAAVAAAVAAAAIGYIQVELGKNTFDVDVEAARAAFPVGEPLGTNPPATSVDGGVVTFGRWKGAIPDPDFPLTRVGDHMRAFFQLKRWHFVSISTDRYFVALAIANLNYVRNVFAYLVDKSDPSAAVAQYSGLAPLSYGVTTSHAPNKRCSMASGLFHICPRAHGGFHFAGHVYLRTPGEAHDRRMLFDFSHEEPEPFSMVFPHKTGRPAYVQKSAGAVAQGMLYLEGEETEYEWDNGLAVSDYTASWAERETRWKWASLATRANVTTTRAGAAPARSEARVGFHLSAEMYEIDGANTENTVWVEDRVTALDPVDFTLPDDPKSQPWRISTADGSVDLTFTPWGARAAREDFKVVVSDFIQPFGTFSGTLRFRDGDTTVQVELDEGFGVVENHYAKW